MAHTPQHSPLPWTHTRSNVNDISDATDNSLFNSTDYYPWCSANEADWPFIVKAVNCHQELVDALKALLANDRLVNLPDKGPSYDEGWQSDELLTLWSNVRAALAKAEA